MQEYKTQENKAYENDRIYYMNSREGSLHLEDGYQCDKCKNKGYIAKYEYAEEVGYWAIVEHECACMKVRKTIRRMHRSGLKNVFGRYQFDTYHAAERWQEIVKSKAEAYVQEKCGNPQADDWFFIGGASGAGKTHLCTAICRELLLHGQEVRYMLWRDESGRLKASVNEPEYARAINELKQVEVLYIDDFLKCGYRKDGSQKPTAADLNLAFEILNVRYSNPALITIISSEMTLDDLFDIDEAIAGRIVERALHYKIVLTGSEKNYRRKLAAGAVISS